MAQPPVDTYRQRLWVTLGSVVLVVFLGVLVWRAANVLLLLFIGLLLAVTLRSLSHPLARLTRLPEGVSLVAVVLLGITLLVGVGTLLVPTLAAQIDNLVQEVPRAAADFRETLAQSGWGRRLLEQAASPADAVPSLPSTLLPQVGSVFSFTFGTLANIVFVLFVTLFSPRTPSSTWAA